MTQTTTHDLWNDGRAMTLTAVKPTPTTLQLTWTLPPTPIAYDGAVVLLSEEPLTAQDYPVDGTRYTGSLAWGTPVDTIGKAQVVAAFYGFFGDDTTQLTAMVNSLDPNKVYYASIHAASSVLQYYTLGVQSYPLEANDPQVRKSSPFAGSIPQATVPPQNPTDGQLYYDPSTNTVLVWNDAQTAWLKANQLPVGTGAVPPLNVGQLFYVSGTNQLKFFDGTQWVLATGANMRVKMGGTWAPYTSITEVVEYPSNPTSGDFVFIGYRAAISAPRTFYVKFASVGQWYNPTPDMVEVFIGGDWVPTAPTSYQSIFGSTLPTIPNVGDFFYQTSSRELLVWTGPTGWKRGDTAEQGVPLQEKVGVGTDGTQAARLQLKQTIKTQLGFPAICVELNDQNFEVAINNALGEARRRLDNAYEPRFISFTLTGGPSGGQQTYYLNDPRDKTDKVVNVIKIHRINQLGISSLSAESGLYAQAFFNQLYQGSNVDVLSIHLMNQLSEVYERIFAGSIAFTWNEARRELTLQRRILQQQERVVLETVMEREEQELINDRWTKMWIQGWAYADAMEQLGLIRSKYGTLPGAQGGLTLNGDSLLAKATELKADLVRQVNDYEVGNGGVNFGNTSFFLG